MELSGGMDAKVAKRDLLRAEVDRLRNPNYAPIRGPLPSPLNRTGELPEGMNHYTVAKPSLTSGSMLRTQFMDEGVNNQLKNRTQSDLRKWKSEVNLPHPSYDIDGDGFISQDDYKLAKRFDADGNGVIDKEEMDAGKRLIAKELWEKYRMQHFLQKAPITDAQRKSNVDDLVKLKDEHGAFMNSFEAVKNKHWIEEQRGSAQVLACVSKPDKALYAPNMYQHPVPCEKAVKTRSELFEERKRRYTREVNER